MVAVRGVDDQQRSVSPQVARSKAFDAAAREIRDADHGHTCVLIDGQPGIGKTTLWRAVVDTLRSDGLMIRTARCAEAEQRLSFSTLDQLLQPLDEALCGTLPEIQQQALRVVCCRAPPDRRVDRRVLTAAVAGYLGLLAGSSRCVLAIDDLHWIDVASERVLGGSVRRIADSSSVTLFLARRVGSGAGGDLIASVPPDAVSRSVLPPLSDRAIGQILRERFGDRPTNAELRTVLEAARGNPLFAIEIVRGFLDPVTEPSFDVPLPVPPDLGGQLSARLAALPSTTRRTLLLAALAVRPSVALIEAASPAGVDVDVACRRGIASDVIELAAGSIRFTHPLLGSCLSLQASETDRRLAHRRLASVATDPEERAHHLVAAGGPRSEAVASAIEQGARWAHDRGAPWVAADLHEAAAARTPSRDPASIARRRRDAALNLSMTGSSEAAAELLRGETGRLPPGEEHARTALALANATFADDPAGMIDTLDASLRDDAAGISASLASEINAFLAWATGYAGDLASADRYAQAAVDHAQAAGDVGILAAALVARAFIALERGRGPDPRELETILAMDVPPGRFRVADHPHMLAGVLLMDVERLERGLEVLEHQLAIARRQGDDLSAASVLWNMGGTEFELGRWDSARRHLMEAVRFHEGGGGTAMGSLADLAEIEVCQGDVDDAIRHAEAAVQAAAERSSPRIEVGCRTSLASVRSWSGDPSGGAEEFRTALGLLTWTDVLGTDEARIGCEAVETFLEAGSVEEAQHELTSIDHRQHGGSHHARGNVERARGLALAASGSPERARDALAEAVRIHERAGMPFELGRSLLALAGVERRLRRRRQAREALARAEGCFAGLGARTWLRRVDAERARISGRAPRSGALTPGDEQIVALVAEGRSNEEIAAALFCSRSTVESHLRSIYRTLGVRSRAELIVRALGDGTVQPSST